MLTPGELKDIAAAVQSLAIAAGVAVGGAWTLYTFWNLRMGQKARAELLQIERNQEPGFQMSIKTRVIASPESNGYTAIIELELKNPSKRTILLDLADHPVSLAHLDYEGRTKPSIAGKPIHISAFNVEARSLKKQEVRFLRAGDVRHTIHVCSVPEAGLYLVQAKVTYGQGSLKLLEGDDSPSEFQVQAVEQAILEVGGAGHGDA